MNRWSERKAKAIPDFETKREAGEALVELATKDLTRIMEKVIRKRLTLILNEMIPEDKEDESLQTNESKRKAT